MEKNLTEDLMPSQIVRIDLDILLQKVIFLVKSHVNEERIIKIYELKVLMVKEFNFKAEYFKALYYSKLNFIKVNESDKGFYIFLQMFESDMNIKILCQKLEWNFIAQKNGILPMY